MVARKLEDMKKNLFILSLILFGFSMFTWAQTNNNDFHSDFNKYKAFAPLFMQKQANVYHSATGNPGALYWQNQADYEIHATLDTTNKQIKGEVTITYTNNSPYKLHNLWLQLDQNTFRKDARSTALYPDKDRNGVKHHTKGYNIKTVEINGDKAPFIITDTRMQIQLKKPLKADGKKIEIHLIYSFEIPFHGKDRMGRVKTKNGWIYTLAQWYPRMAVYDEVEGWNNIPYLGTGEFYLEYGNFDYYVTVPENMIVAGSGVLQNSKKVLTKTIQNRLKKAKESDKTVTILSKKEMLEGTHHVKSKNGMLTWHFKMDNSRDVAWTASDAFIWDAARINLPDNKTALAQSVYPVENSDTNGYARSTEYTKHCIEIYSKKLLPYPYKVATNVGAHELGMEYPGIVFCSYKSKSADLWGVINHEFGHTWFPMIVGSNERVYGWMDEGLNTYINDIATKAFNNGEYYVENDLQSMGSYLFDASLDPIFTRADVIHSQQNLGIGAYYKPATALQVLRNVILGKERFDRAFNTYINRWKYKHPQPWDFFNTMSNVSGENLSWFFRGWFMNNWRNDQGVKSITYVDNDPTKGAKIALINYGEMAMPVTLEVTFSDKSTQRIKLPVAIWMTGPKYIYHLSSTKKIKSVVLDPDQLVPDASIINNKLIKLEPTPTGITAKNVIAYYIKAIGGKEKIEKINDISIERTANLKGFPITFYEKFKQPDKYLTDIKVNDYSMIKFVTNGDDIAIYYNNEKQTNVDSETKAQILNRSGKIFPETHYKKEQIELTLLGVQTTEESDYYVVQIADTAGNIIARNFYNTTSNLKSKSITNDGYVIKFYDYKDFDGILFPIHSTTPLLGGSLELKITDLKINKGIEDRIFQ